MNLSFQYANKNELAATLPMCFALLHANMNIIVPTGNSYEKDFDDWYSEVYPAMQKEPRQIVLLYDGDVLIGYFQYYVSRGTLMMEEIQLRKEYQGSGVFRAFYSWLLNELPKDLERVEAYAHKRNTKSQGILEHLGLLRCGENKNGNSYFYRGSYSSLFSKYGK